MLTNSTGRIYLAQAAIAYGAHRCLHGHLKECSRGFVSSARRWL